MARNEQKGIKDFYLAGDRETGVKVVGKYSMREAFALMKHELMKEDAMELTNWLPDGAPPAPPAPLREVLSKPDVLKSVASLWMKWALKKQGLKMGEVSQMQCTIVYCSLL